MENVTSLLTVVFISGLLYWIALHRTQFIESLNVYGLKVQLGREICTFSPSPRTIKLLFITKVIKQKAYLRLIIALSLCCGGFVWNSFVFLHVRILIHRFYNHSFPFTVVSSHRPFGSAV